MLMYFAAKMKVEALGSPHLHNQRGYAYFVWENEGRVGIINLFPAEVANKFKKEIINLL